MATFHIDLVNGNDSGTGLDWANAWKTITNGATAARIAAGDLIKISKTPAPYSIGNATWYANNESLGGFPATKNIVSSTNATPIVMTVTNHGYSNGDILRVDAHTSNTAANGVWEIANVAANTFELVGSVGSASGTGNGTVQKVNSSVVLLSTAQTKNIDRCQVAWTAANSSTVTANNGNYNQCGYYSMRCVLPASPATSTKYAYRALPASTDFSAYQNISLYIAANNDIAVNKYKICLCSDTAGDVIVDTFLVPIVEGNVGTGTVFNIARSGGGNLGNAIQSIALYSDTSAPTGSQNVYLDNIIACTSTGLNLCSLISKTGTEQDFTKDWYVIRSINDKVINIGRGWQNVSNPQILGRGYIETGETITTYARESFAYPLSNSNGNSIETLNRAGNFASGYVEYSGGWNTSNNTQDGETFLDGRSYCGYGFYSIDMNFLKFKYLNFYRYYEGMYFWVNSNLSYLTFNHCRFGFNGYYDLDWYALSHQITIDTCRFVNSNNTLRVPTACIWWQILNSYFANSSGYGIQTSSTIKIINCEIYNHVNSGFYGQAHTSSYINNSKFKKNGSNAILPDADALIYGYNNLIEDATEFNTYTGSGSAAYMYSQKHDQTANNHWIFFYNGSTINSQAATMTNATGTIEWKITISHSTAHTYHPVFLRVGRIAVGASTQVTATIYVKKAHATNVGVRLVCKGGQIAGVDSDVIATAADNTNEQQLSISFTPTEAGVVQLQVEGYYIAGNSTILVDNLAVTQS